ncbi:MAG: tetratricopeptide repeat protein [Caulobacter sp.]
MLDLGVSEGGEAVAAPAVAIEPAPVPTPVVAAEPVVEAAPEPALEPAPEPHVAFVAAPEPVPQPVAAPVAPPPAEADFATLRAELLTLTAAESWNPAARVLARMVRAARTDRERAVAHRDLGDFAAGQGRHDDAAEAYEEAVSYARSVRKASPDDPSADELLAGALAGVGDVAEAEGRLNEALAAFEESLALRRSPGGREAADPGAQRALSVALERLADLREDRGHRMRALDLYRESYDVTARLAAADPARFGLDLAATRARLAEIEARVAG